MTRAVAFSLVFDQKGPWNALNTAQGFLQRAGWSYGNLQAHARTGLMFGHFGISKWRNMTPSDVEALHGSMFALSYREGPVVMVIYATAPPEGVKAARHQATIEGFTDGNQDNNGR